MRKLGWGGEVAWQGSLREWGEQAGLNLRFEPKPLRMEGRMEELSEEGV